MHRSPQNPIITRLDIKSADPRLCDVSSVFNPGAIRLDGQVHLLLRVQNRGRETFLLQASSNDGLDFDIDTTPAVVEGLDRVSSIIYHVYDPRITVVEGQLLVTLAVDTNEGCRTIITRGENLSQLEYVGDMWSGEARNGVVFPEKIGGSFVGLVRPNVPFDDNPASGSEIWLVESDDLATWRPIKAIMAGRPHYWDELIGSGPPPAKTAKGWLHLYHGIATHFAASNIYQAGVALLDLKDPSKVIARSRYNILEPRESYELNGQVPNVVFPTGMTVDSIDQDGFALGDSDVTIYFGAADTSVAAATTTIDELMAQCHAGSE